MLFHSSSSSRSSSSLKSLMDSSETTNWLSFWGWTKAFRKMRLPFSLLGNGGNTGVTTDDEGSCGGREKDEAATAAAVLRSCTFALLASLSKGARSLSLWEILRVHSDNLTVHQAPVLLSFLRNFTSYK